ncbi:hypothetical protein KP509_11G087500 [Ceratopteris richardii]|uniref:Solute carrier family 35 member F1 n=1 Tax=Ceratopteris richardii TaxID=49495 RepID=A0A8T2TXL0_CERRI|nr:hypothetical protein KP509_11G087500 [Ceratopteris richardii]
METQVKRSDNAEKLENGSQNLDSCKDGEAEADEEEIGAGDTKKRWCRSIVGLGLGQVLSLLITMTGVSSSRLAFLGIHAPATQSLLNYILLATIYGSIYVFQRRKLKVQWYYMAILALVDVEANYLVVKAYQYTTITSILLLDKGSLLFVLALTWIILKKRHTLGELAGVLVCMAGVIVLFFSDMQPNVKKGTKDLIIGDVFVLIGSLLYAFDNVLEEVIMQTDGVLEVSTWLGLFGTVFSACQLCILEIKEIRTIKWSASEVFPFLGYAVSLFLFYTLVPIFLKVNGSTSLNLTLISSDIWAMLIKKFIYKQNIAPLYYAALSIVVLGLIIHSTFNQPKGSRNVDDLLTNRSKEQKQSNYLE